jgi:hypothetical protein
MRSFKSRGGVSNIEGRKSMVSNFAKQNQDVIFGIAQDSPSLFNSNVKKQQLLQRESTEPFDIN